MYNWPLYLNQMHWVKHDFYSWCHTRITDFRRMSRKINGQYFSSTCTNKIEYDKHYNNSPMKNLECSWEKAMFTCKSKNLACCFLGIHPSSQPSFLYVLAVWFLHCSAIHNYFIAFVLQNLNYLYVIFCSHHNKILWRLNFSFNFGVCKLSRGTSRYLKDIYD